MPWFPQKEGGEILGILCDLWATLVCQLFPVLLRPMFIPVGRAQFFFFCFDLYRSCFAQPLQFGFCFTPICDKT